MRSDGRVALELKTAWHDDTRELVFEPLEFAVIRKILAHLGIAHVGPSPGPVPPALGAAAP